MSDAWTMLQKRKRASGGTPVVTFVDLARRERTELSAVSLENAAAKIANALRDEFEMEPGMRVGLHLPPHWQRSAWCAGAWVAGCIVVPGATDADLLVASATLAPGLVGGTREVAVVSMHPFGLPLTEPLPGGATDVTVAVRQQPDAYLFDPPRDDYAALEVAGTAFTQDEAFAAAAQRASAWGLTAGGTLLVPEDLDDLDAWLGALAVPVSAEASVVLVTGGAPTDELRAGERITASAERSR
ncbi:MAG: TIGR03089 family protein [bacterium]|nr:TIGR03089 family protein [bacterium]